MTDMKTKLNLDILRDAVSGSAAAFRCVTKYQPAGGAGDKVFPPTYAEGKYATEERVDPESGEVKKCVLLDSVQSQANRMELALLEAHRSGSVKLPLIVTKFDQEDLPRQFSVSSLEAPHRAADALFRDSLLGGEEFRKSDRGRILDSTDVRNATELFGLCPTALIFGLWDSTGPRGGLGAKFQRALVSEIVGYGAIKGIDTASRIDPASIEKGAGPVFRTQEGDWTLSEEDAKKDDKGKPILFKQRQGKDVPFDAESNKGVPDQGRPSVINHGNVTPDYAFVRNQNGQLEYDTERDSKGNKHQTPRIKGGFTISHAVQTTVLSLSAIRRLRFPLAETDQGKQPDPNVAARTTLAALGLAAGTLARVDTDLRSRCHLFAESSSTWQLLDRPGRDPLEFDLEPESVLALLAEAITCATRAGLPWEKEEIVLKPSDKLIELVRRSQKLAGAPEADES